MAMNNNSQDALNELVLWLKNTFGSKLKYFDAEKVAEEFAKSDKCDLSLSFSKLKKQCIIWYANYVHVYGAIVNY